MPSQYFGNARAATPARARDSASLTWPLTRLSLSGRSRASWNFAIEAFNVLNATNFQQPDSAITDGASFGTYTAANAYPARQVQVALRLNF